MKVFNISFRALWALWAMLLVASCSQEAQQPLAPQGEESSSLSLEIAPELDLQELRAMTITTANNKPQFTHDSRTDWKTHCFIRNADGTQQAYAEVNWEVVDSTAGQIKLKMKGHELKLLTSGGSPLPTPQPGEEWFIAGIAGGGRLNDTRTQVDFSYDAGLDGTLANDQVRVPLAFGWTKFVVAGANQRAPRISVRLKPQGSLFRIRVDNLAEGADFDGKTYVAGNVKILSNALTQKGAFDYGLGSTAEAPISGAMPSYNFGSGNEVAVNEVIQRPVEVDLNAYRDVLIWAYPRPSAHLAPSQAFSTKIYLPHYHTYDTKTFVPHGLRNAAFANGHGYRTTLHVYRPKMGLEYIMPRHLSPSGGEFAASDKVSDAGYFSFEQAKSIVSNYWGGYHLPRGGEVEMALFGGISYGAALKGEDIVVNQYLDNDGLIGDKRYRAKRLWGAKQVEAGKTTLHSWTLFEAVNYAKLKFVVGTRYELEPSQGDDSRAVVSSFFLHGKQDLDGLIDNNLQDLAGASYASMWQDARNSYRVVFPIGGMYLRNPATGTEYHEGPYTRGAFWMGNELRFVDFYINNDQLYANGMETSSSPGRFNLRLFSDE